MPADDAKMGPKLRELRISRGVPQIDAAKRLDISPAYLSLIEKGKRAIQLPILFRALDVYGVTMEEFTASLGAQHIDDGLARLLDEPLLRSLDLTTEDLASLGSEPKTVTTITALFNLYKTARTQLDNLLLDLARREHDDVGAAPRFELSPYDEVTDFLEKNENWFPALEESADRVRRSVGLSGRPSRTDLMRMLEEGFGVAVSFVAPDAVSSVVRRFDPERGTLVLSTAMPETRLKFQLAVAIAQHVLELEQLHESIAEAYRTRHAQTRALIKIHLANYFAGALLLPYDEFLSEVQRTRYDIELLASLFETSYETIAHRVCNLADPRKRGLPFHFIRVDVAGNISKRYSATKVRFAYQSGSCPKSAAHLAFLTPSVLTRQYEVYPDGDTYFCFAKVVSDPKAGSLARGTVYSIALGTSSDHSKHLAYADEMPFVDPKRMAVPVGTTCRFCERTECNQRAAPSYKFAFRVDPYTKKDNFFSPVLKTDVEEGSD